MNPATFNGLVWLIATVISLSLVAGSLEEEDCRVGGEGVVVEMDECKMGKRKFHKGHHVEGVWIVGGIERTAEKIVFVCMVADRTKETLHRVIERHVAPGSILHTDMWKGYVGVEQLGFRHRTVNHAQTFKDPLSGTHTNTIEGFWNGLKIQIAPRSRVQDGMGGRLLEKVWRKRNRLDLWGGFIRAMRDTYYSFD